jgi:hypothetical protein
MKKYKIEVNGKIYELTIDEARKNLPKWKAKLKKEGKRPNESTIEVVDNLEAIATIKDEASPFEMASNTEGVGFLECVGIFAFVFFAWLFFPSEAVKESKEVKAIEPTQATPLTVVRDEKETDRDIFDNILRAVGITIFADVANENPVDYKKKGMKY